MFSPNVVKYSDILKLRPDEKWTDELNDSVAKTGKEVAQHVAEYAAHAEEFLASKNTTLEDKPAAFKEIMQTFPELVSRNTFVKNLLVALFGSQESKVKGALYSYGNTSPIGCIIDHVKIVGMSPLKTHLSKFFLR